MVRYTILTLRIDSEEIKALLHVPLGTSTLTLPFKRSLHQRACRAKDSPCQTCPRWGPSAWDANLWCRAAGGSVSTTQASPCAMCVNINVRSKGRRSNCSHKKATHQLRKQFLASTYVPPGGGKLRNSCFWSLPEHGSFLRRDSHAILPYRTKLT